MITYPNAKINLGLNITAKRPDGYHNIETLFYPVPLCDVLEFVEAPKTTLEIEGLTIDGDIEQNLVIKAFRVLQTLHDLPEIAVYLQKNIPMGAGLGGGSSDAAFMLKMLNNNYKLKMNDAYLEEIAITLGADCPFFIRNKPILAYGLGNEFCAVDFSMKGKWIVLIKPNIHINTKEAYSLITTTPWKVPIVDVFQMPVKHWPEYLKNDFEIPLFEKHPELREIKGFLYSQGAFYASMSGSGSTMFGLFDQEVSISKDDLPKHCQVFIKQLDV